MKRVLNSGTIRLPFVAKEEDLLHTLGDGKSHDLRFNFDIKAPLLTFLTFQDSNLGTLNRNPKLDHPIAYLPSQFYTTDNMLLDSKDCNTYNSKLFNFYTAAINFYNKLIADGMNREQAALVLPQGMLINFSWEVKASELIWFIEKYYNASPEIYGYCCTLVIYLEEHLPDVTRWLKQNRWQSIGL